MEGFGIVGTAFGWALLATALLVFVTKWLTGIALLPLLLLALVYLSLSLGLALRLERGKRVRQ
jgi:hypothetical protein